MANEQIMIAVARPNSKMSTDSSPNPSVIPVVLDVRVVTGSGGGPEKTILNSPRLLQPAGYRNLCAYMHPPEDSGFEFLRRRAEQWDAPLLCIPDRGLRDWKVIARLLEICRREKVAIWHGHDYKSDLIGLILRGLHPMRLVTTVHGWGVQSTRRLRLYNRIDRMCVRFYERVICVSQDLREECLAAGARPERCVLIENGIDTEQYTRRVAREEAKRRLGIAPHRLLVGAVGRLSAEKGFDVLIRAVNRLVGEGFDVELAIAGEGDQRPHLERLISTLGCGERVRLLGFRADTVEIYEAMDVYALSSFSEGLPNVVLEAMAMEVPVVATRVGAIPQLMDHERNGLIVEPGSHDELARGLGRLLRDPRSRTSAGAAGRERVAANYSFAARMRKIRAIYDDLLKRKPVPERVDRTARD
jgi:glycosyltransferase involved in cell wall biosynthesis